MAISPLQRLLCLPARSLRDADHRGWRFFRAFASSSTLVGRQRDHPNLPDRRHTCHQSGTPFTPLLAMACGAHRHSPFAPIRNRNLQQCTPTAQGVVDRSTRWAGPVNTAISRPTRVRSGTRCPPPTHSITSCVEIAHFAVSPSQPSNSEGYLRVVSGLWPRRTHPAHVRVVREEEAGRVSCRLRSPLHGTRFCDNAPHGLSMCAALLRLCLSFLLPPPSSLAHTCTDMKRYTKPAGEHVGSSANIPGPIPVCFLYFIV